MSSHHTDSNDYMALMNVICDMSQFVVIVPVPDESSATLASYFMQHMLLKFGFVPVFDESSTTLASYFMQHVLLKFVLCHLVVLDDGTPFKKSLSPCVKLYI